ncbi:Type 2 DNA topoisomerase 6 subunit B [uncultured archaeon]|nr:Type 2 DNA topoisomerase 6 subunit B [uncultured archaeon]
MVEKELTAEKMAAAKEVSVAEFFEKNKHLLGYENLQKSLLTCIKEAVDNSLDACEEARILPTIYVEIKRVGETGDRFKLIIEDNGPGIVKKNIPRIFGKLLYGSKFHRLKQSRGQQGIGISAAVLYAQLTTGRPTKVYSRPSDGFTHIFELHLNTQKNEPEIVSEASVTGEGHGTRIEMEIKGKYTRGKQSVLEYLLETAILNPYCTLIFLDPDGEKFEFTRAVDKLPPEAKEIQPHPEGIELGILIRMLKNTPARNLRSFLTNEFSRVGGTKAGEICDVAGIDPKVNPTTVTRDEAEKLLDAMQKAKLQNPPTDCLSPVGQESVEKGLKKEVQPEFVAAITRPPSVYSGRPFQIEVGIAYGGKLESEGAIQIYRFANKMPLLYDQSACAVTKAILQTDWKRYGLNQSNGGLPSGPVAVSVHLASVWVPYTSEGKEAIASYPEIIKEIKLAIQEAGRKLGMFLSARHREHMLREKASIFQRYAEDLVASVSNLTGKPVAEIQVSMQKLLDNKGLVVDEEEEKKEEVSEEEESADTKRRKEYAQRDAGEEEDL